VPTRIDDEDLVERIREILRLPHEIDRLADGPERRDRDQLRLHPPARRPFRIVEGALEGDPLGRRELVENLRLILCIEILEDVDGVIELELADTLDESLRLEFLEDLLRRQYQGLDVHDPQAARRERLGAIANAVVEALERGDYSPGPLVAGLARASRGRHLLAWSSNPGDERTWEKTGVAGSLSPRSLAVSLLNRGGNKLDPFLEAEAALDLHPVADSTHVTVRLKVANRTPEGLSQYIAGPFPGSGVGEGEYLGIVAINLPGAATDIVLDGAGPLVAGGADGPTQVLAAPLRLARQQDTTVTVQFRLPPAQTSIEVVPSARVPAIRWQSGRNRWKDHAPQVVGWRWE
jgi:hypothetical protein